MLFPVRNYDGIILMAPQGMTNMRRQLQKGCSDTLHRYMSILSEGCDLLRDLQEDSLTEEQREKIFSNRKEQLLAHDAYDRAQRQLWRFLSDAELPAHLDNSPQPKRNSSERSSRERREKDKRIG
jgi:hypothetical protein